MHVAHLRLRDFRNYGRLDADFAAGFHLLLGDNAQGKTNILEAIYLIATLRSFRGVGGAQMIRHAQKGYFIGATVISRASHEATIFTEDAAKLGQQLGSEITKSSALEFGQAPVIGIGQGLGIV